MSARNRFIVQAFSNVDGWQNTGHGGKTEQDAQTAASALMLNLSAWMNRKPTQCRVIDTLPASVKNGEVQP